MLLIGDPASRRARLLETAVAARGGRLKVIAWQDLFDVSGRAALRDEAFRHRWCKIDSPGENPIVTDALVRRGWQRLGAQGAPPAPLNHGETIPGAWWYTGFSDLLRQVMQRIGWITSLNLLNDLSDILYMTDKYRCQQVLHAAGAVVPQLLGFVRSAEELFDTYDARSAPRLFIKARYGSSAAGVVALARHRDGRYAATTSARFGTDGRLYNHLRVSRLNDRRDIHRLIDRLAVQGAYAERWIAKPRAPTTRDLHHDLRVVAFRGRARQRIARLSAAPLTNLHLGNRRTLPHWHDAADDAALERASATAAAAFPGARSIGLDLILRGGQAVVLEANAFGDLLPGLVHDGCTTYDDQAALACADEC